jgi:hypothetical protein
MDTLLSNLLLQQAMDITGYGGKTREEGGDSTISKCKRINPSRR